jgi:hypothetical protein
VKNNEVKKIKRVSDRGKQRNHMYAKKRKVFLAEENNRFCPVCKAAFEGLIDIEEIDNYELIKRYKGLVFATEIHHKKGRIGKLLNHTPYWLAVSRIGHVWIHKYPEKAYELDFLIHSTHI